MFKIIKHDICDGLRVKARLIHQRKDSITVTGGGGIM